jgi:hypothetical protein
LLNGAALGKGQAAKRARTPVAAALLLVLLASCSQPPDGLPPAPSPSSPTAGPPVMRLTAEERAAVDEVRDLFDEFMTGYVDLATSGEPPTEAATRSLQRASTGSLGNDIAAELANNYLRNRRFDGTLHWFFVEVANIDLEHERFGDPSPLLLLRYCLDATDWRILDRVTGETIPDNHLVFVAGVRHQGTLQATRRESRWRIAHWEHEVQESC